MLSKITRKYCLSIHKISLSRFSKHNISQKKMNLREIDKIKTFEAANEKKKEEHEDYIRDKDRFEIQSYFMKIGCIVIVSGSIFMLYGLFNYPHFSKRYTDSLLTSGSLFNLMAMMFAGSYLGFHIRNSNSTAFIKSSTNFKLMTIPLGFSLLGAIHFCFLDNLSSMHIVPFIIVNLGVLTLDYWNKKKLFIPSWYLNYRFISVALLQLIYVILSVYTIYPEIKLNELQSKFNRKQQSSKGELPSINLKEYIR